MLILEKALFELSMFRYGKARFGVELEMVAPFEERNAAYYQIRQDLKDKYPEIGTWHAKPDSSIRHPKTIAVPIRSNKTNAIDYVTDYIFGITDNKRKIEALKKMKADKLLWAKSAQLARKYIKKVFDEDVPIMTTTERYAIDIELITPPTTGLEYSVLNLKNVRMVINYLHKEGYQVNKSTGLHVHFSVPSENYTSFNMLALALKVYEHEDEIYDLFPGRKDNEFTRSIKNNMKYIIELFDNLLEYNTHNDIASIKNTLETLLKKVNVIERVSAGGERYYGLNLVNISGRNTIEFRYAAGTLDADEVLDWIKRCADFMTSLLTHEIIYKDITIQEKIAQKQYVIIDNIQHKKTVVDL